MYKQIANVFIGFFKGKPRFRMKWIKTGSGKKTMDSQCWQNRSRYWPHQGEQEIARRQKQAAGFQ